MVTDEKGRIYHPTLPVSPLLPPVLLTSSSLFQHCYVWCGLGMLFLPVRLALSCSIQRLASKGILSLSPSLSPSLYLSLSPYLFLSPSLVRTQSQGALRGTCEQSLPALAAIALFANALRICFTYAQAEPGTGEALFDRRRGSRESHLSLRLLGPSCPLT